MRWGWGRNLPTKATGALDEFEAFITQEKEHNVSPEIDLGRFRGLLLTLSMSKSFDTCALYPLSQLPLFSYLNALQIW